MHVEQVCYDDLLYKF